MKVYVHEKGFTLSGKGWEVVEKLKEYNRLYSSVSEWIEAVSLRKAEASALRRMDWSALNEIKETRRAKQLQ